MRVQCPGMHAQRTAGAASSSQGAQAPRNVAAFQGCFPRLKLSDDRVITPGHHKAPVNHRLAAVAPTAGRPRWLLPRPQTAPPLPNYSTESVHTTSCAAKPQHAFVQNSRPRRVGKGSEKNVGAQCVSTNQLNGARVGAVGSKAYQCSLRQTAGACSLGPPPPQLTALPGTRRGSRQASPRLSFHAVSGLMAVVTQGSHAGDAGPLLCGRAAQRRGGAQAPTLAAAGRPVRRAEGRRPGSNPPGERPAAGCTY